MPYIPKLGFFKTGINPSLRSKIDLENLTPSDKVKLASRRIFGYNFGGNHNSGFKVLAAKLHGAKKLCQFETPLNHNNRYYPSYKDTEKEEFEKILKEKLRMRILMRGVKLGKKKGGEKISIMSIFEKKKAEE